MSSPGVTPEPEDPIDPQGYVPIDTTAQVLGTTPGRVVELFRVRDLVPNDPALATYVTYRSLVEVYERDVAGVRSSAPEEADDDETAVAVC